MLLTTASTHGIIVDRQFVLCTGSTGLTFDRHVRQKRELDFCASKPAGQRALQKGVIPNSDVGVVHFASQGNEVFARTMLPRLAARGTGESTYGVNSAANLVRGLARGQCAPQQSTFPATSLPSWRREKSCSARGQSLKKCVTVCHPCQKHTAPGDGLPRLRRESGGECVVNRQGEKSEKSHARQVKTRETTTTNLTNLHE